MIDEDTLSSLLTEHALRIPVPETGIDALLAESPRRESAPGARWKSRPSARVLAAAAVVLVVGGAGVVVAHSHHSPARAASSALDRATTATGPPAAGGPGRAGSGGDASARYSESAGGDQLGLVAVPTDGVVHNPAGTSTKSEAQSGSGSGSTATAPTDTARVVRTGAIDLMVKRHTFGTVVGRVTTISASEGGFVADAATNESAATPSGTMTVRVPSGRFSDTVGRLRGLGTVETASTRGVDVTGQYTDLQARLHAAQSTRDAYLGVLAKATNIGDILAVQDRIEGVQTQIEQLQGQISSLDTRTTYATVTLAIAEPGPKPKPVVKPHHEAGLEVAWDNARDGFARRVEGLISHSGSALVILLGLVLLAFALRLLVPRARRLLV